MATLRLEELTDFDISARLAARDRNLERLSAAKDIKEISHLDFHYSCAVCGEWRVVAAVVVEKGRAGVGSPLRAWARFGS